MDIFSNEKKEAIGLLRFIYKRRKLLLGGILLGIGIGLMAYFMLPDKFRSNGIIYPSNPYNREELISNPQFGYDIEAERLMQLLESRSMRDKVVRQFGLVDYYGIDTTKNGWREVLTVKYVGDVQFERSKYLSIVISAELKDPDLAADVVNYIIEFVNEYRMQIYSGNISAELEYLKKRRDLQRKRFQSVRAKIYAVKDTNDIENIIENYLLKSAKDQYYDSDFINNVQMTEWLEDYKTQKHKFHEYDLAYQKALEVSKRPVLKDYVIDNAVPVHKPVFPSLIVNVLLGAIGGFFVSFFLVWILGQWKQLRRTIDSQ